MHSCPSCGNFVDPEALRCPHCAAPLPARGGAVQQDDRLSPGAWSRLTRVCGWCGSSTRDARDPDCDACGGPLPPLPPRVLAELDLHVPAMAPPPPAPRALPPGYEFRVRIGRNFLVLFGGAFITFAFVTAWMVVFDRATRSSENYWVVPLAVAVFGACGTIVLREGWRRAERWIRALRDGDAVEGTIVRVVVDTSQGYTGTSFGGKRVERHPLRIDFRYEAPAGTQTGFVTSWDPLSGKRETGERIWVVFDDRAPSCSAPWPPVW